MWMELMHRHRKLIMLFIALFIGLPMLFFIPGVGRLGGPSMRSAANMPIAQVGKIKITAQKFINRYTQVQEDRNRAGQPATAQDMVNDGTVDAIVDGLIREALIVRETQEDRVYPDRTYLVERLKEDQFFKNDQGEFDPAAFNQWVQGRQRAGLDWDPLYEDLAKDVNRQAYMKLIGASAHVNSREVRQQFDRLNTELKIRAIAIAPKVELTEEQLQSYYDAHEDQFMTPEQRVAEFISVSLKPPTPPIVDEILQRARAGEDFAELAREYSEGLDAEEGGDLGWITETEATRDDQKVLFEMQPGEVRGPIESFLGLHIYKLIESRVNDQGQREVHARQILIRPQLTEEERNAKEQRLQDLLAKARKEELDLQTLAADEGLEVTRTAPFSNRSQSIEGVPAPDTFVFRQAVLPLEIGKISDVIDGVENLYLAEVAKITAPEKQTFEEARSDVERAAEAEAKQAPEYQQRVSDIVATVTEQAHSIEDVQNLFPDQDFEVKETDRFGINDMLFNQGLFMDTRQIFARFVNSEPGEFAGPFVDLLRVPHFIELVERQAPTGDVWEEQFQTEKDDIRSDLFGSREIARRSDYMQYLLNQANEQALIQKDYDAIFQILGLNTTAAAPSDVTEPAAGTEAQPEAQQPAPRRKARQTGEESTPDVVLDLDEQQPSDQSTGNSGQSGSETPDSP